MLSTSTTFLIWCLYSPQNHRRVFHRLYICRVSSWQERWEIHCSYACLVFEVKCTDQYVPLVGNVLQRKTCLTMLWWETVYKLGWWVKLCFNISIAKAIQGKRSTAENREILRKRKMLLANIFQLLSYASVGCFFNVVTVTWTKVCSIGGRVRKCMYLNNLNIQPSSIQWPGLHLPCDSLAHPRTPITSGPVFSNLLRVKYLLIWSQFCFLDHNMIGFF